jgi:hypothetical protein
MWPSKGNKSIAIKTPPSLLHSLPPSLPLSSPPYRNSSGEGTSFHLLLCFLRRRSEEEPKGEVLKAMRTTGGRKGGKEEGRKGGREGERERERA